MHVELKNGKIHVGDREIFLMSGAIHYWRLHPNSWANTLQAALDMGLETVETYVPWEFHETEKNVFDFTGQTDSRRNLVGFLELVKNVGLWLIIRPGPLIYAEWVNQGLPTDVARYHRLHPDFKKRAEHYIEAVCRVIVPYQATQGGNIILLQPDNEADPFEYAYEEQLGLDGKPGLFHDYLKEKFQNVELLNHRWGTKYKKIEEAMPVMSYVDHGPNYLNRYIDFIGFRFWYVNKCMAYYGDLYRSNGIDVPLLHNTYDVMDTQDFRGLTKEVDLVGIDAYPPDEYNPPQIAGGGENITHQKFMETMRYFRTFTDSPYIAEFECGIGHGLHYYSGVLHPNQLMFNGLTALLAGVVGWNWFMLVNRDNWMMCPINEWGRKELELFTVCAKLVDLHKQINMPRLKKLTNTSITFNLHHWILRGIFNDPALIAVYDTGMDYEHFNLETGTVDKPLLFYTGFPWLDEKHQQVLVDYIENGGNLVCFQSYPYLDEEQKELNLLGIKFPDRVLSEPFLDHYATELEADFKGYLARTRAPAYIYDRETPGEPIFASRASTDIYDTGFEENQFLRSLVIGRRYQIGYYEKRGKGSITIIGVRPTPDWIIGIHRYLNVPIPASTSTPEIHLGLFEGADGYYLILINLSNKPQIAEIKLDPSLNQAHLKATSLVDGIALEDRLLADGILYVHLPRKYGTIISLK